MPAKKQTRSRANSDRSGSAKTTTSHETIKPWVEKRGAHPATVKGTTSDTTGVLRIDFPGYCGKDTLKEVSWDEFFKKFDRKKLAFLYQEKTASVRMSRFCNLIDRQQGGRAADVERIIHPLAYHARSSSLS